MCAVWAGLKIRDRIPAFNQDRRALIVASTAAICAAPASIFAFGILTRKGTVVTETEIKFPGLPKDLENIRILQISDIHLSAFLSQRDFARVIDQANELKAHLAIMTGDLITARHDPLEAGLRELSRLKNESGIWACMGNHEHFAGVENIAEQMAPRYGIKFLRTEARSLKFGQHSMNLIGVDYQSAHFQYLPGVEELIEPEQFNILLSHNPDVFPIAVNKGFDLVLSGHTHGGQVNVEIFDHNFNVAEFVTPYTKGLYTKNKSAIYVNSGIGTIGMPIRLGAPPEISLISLKAS
jgi:hypothetical protein